MHPILDTPGYGRFLGVVDYPILHKGKFTDHYGHQFKFKTCSGSEEKALSIMEDHDDETYALLEKLSRRWRLEEHGFLPETLKTAYL